ncbi:MAG TPA: ATP-dependent RecD-like DNA helicase [Synergistaceae bacterium]|nr:ATP-dependent RecD-like DNA helicase [Synergistaceae bacterium]
MDNQHLLEGTIERVTFHSPETGFCVLRIKPQNARDLVTLTGTLSSAHPGEWIRAEGFWKMDPKYGQQFQGNSISITPPGSLEGMQQYLASGMIHGIGKAMAGRLIRAFGMEVFRIIEEEPSRLEEVEGIGPTRSARIMETWKEQKQIRHIMVFLHSHGVGTSRAFRIYKSYGDEAIQRIREDPYCLARDIWGMGFKTADAIAERLGIPRNSLLRGKAGVEFVLQELTGQGHCAYPRKKLEEKTASLLEIPPETVTEAVEEALKTDRLRQHPDIRQEKASENPLLYLTSLDECECRLAEQLLRILRTGPLPISSNHSQALAWAEQQNSLSLGESQRKALLQALENKVCIITGGPGVGKTTIIKILCTLFRGARKTISLCAPTGRAAKRMSETTREEAKTLHRLLEFDPKTLGFKHDARNPLEGDVFIVDEASMIDLVLAWQFLRALPPRGALIMVGDADQLPSVGPGKVLQDCIASGVLPVARLDTIYRQAASSAIITNAHRINRGEFPLFPSREEKRLSDFYLVECEDPERGAELILRMVTERIPRRFGLHPLRDIQVLSPMMRGQLGVLNLNQRLQERLNPSGPSVQRFGSTFREKDKVLQTINNYDKDVFNGDMGYIEKISSEDQEVLVRFDERLLRYSFQELDELILSYAMSVHKSQGSEFPGVVIPVHTQHYMLLQRNLLYTGITRGKELVVLLGTKKALALCLKRAESKARITTLAERLREEEGKKESFS